MDESCKVVAAFDFDGTITYHDTLISFLIALFGRMRVCAGLLWLGPALGWDVLRDAGRQVMKERVLRHFVRGMPYEQLRREGSNFAQCVLPSLVRPEALRRVRWHREQGHHCVLISASVDLYVKPWGEEAGFDDILCSHVQVDRQGKLTGLLVGDNCRGAEKVRRLLACVGEKEHYTLYAYGDSDGDKELLALADHAYYRKMPNDERRDS